MHARALIAAVFIASCTAPSPNHSRDVADLSIVADASDMPFVSDLLIGEGPDIADLRDLAVQIDTGVAADIADASNAVDIGMTDFATTPDGAALNLDAFRECVNRPCGDSCLVDLGVPREFVGCRNGHLCVPTSHYCDSPGQCCLNAGVPVYCADNMCCTDEGGACYADTDCCDGRRCKCPAGGCKRGAINGHCCVKRGDSHVWAGDLCCPGSVLNVRTRICE